VNGLVGSAQGKAPNRVLAWLCAAEAEIAAILRRHDASHDALDRAALSLPAGEEMRDQEVPGVFLNGTHLTRWRGNVRTLLGEPEAIDELHTALTAMDDTFTRAQSSLRIDLAQGYLAQEKLSEAREQARLAANIQVVRAGVPRGGIALWPVGWCLPADVRLDGSGSGGCG